MVRCNQLQLTFVLKAFAIPAPHDPRQLHASAKHHISTGVWIGPMSVRIKTALSGLSKRSPVTSSIMLLLLAVHTASSGIPGGFR